MNRAGVQRIVGLLLALFSLTVLPPIGVALLFDDPHWPAFVESFVLILGAGLVLWWPVRRERRDLRLRDGFVIVSSFWVVLGVFGAAPFLFIDEPQMGVTDAVFESISGLTTTAATVLSGLDGLPPSILYYRQQLQWFGGLGLIVLAVALLPMLGVGGMQLYRAETPGPVKDNKLTPRITQTAKALWYIYLGITVACTAAYWLAGMTVFDAVCHAFSTVSIGGFSTHDANLAYFDDPAIDAIALVFLFVSGVNFSLHFMSWQARSIKNYFQDAEFRAYLWFLASIAIVVSGYLLWTGYYGGAWESIHQGVFHAVSMATTGGFTIDAFTFWPGGLPILLLFSSFVGGCANSTAGGMKVVRWLLMYKQGTREFQRLVHPSAEMPVKLGGKTVPQRIVDSVWGFFAVYVIVFAALFFVMLTTGLDQVSAFAAVAASLNNLGSGLGEVAVTFATLTDVAKWAAVAAMLLGRLEIFTLLVLVTPAFWRR
ncbi:MAG TPA: TrkH family potassium uptake protein [Gammaproteobacteria bacterium]